jgi:hypothetical protein
VVVEFVSPNDEMVAKLTANKAVSELHPGRTRLEFEDLLARRFTVIDTLDLGEGVRVLYHLVPGASQD